MLHRAIRHVLRKVAGDAERLSAEYPACAYLTQQFARAFYAPDAFGQPKLAAECDTIYRGLWTELERSPIVVRSDGRIELSAHGFTVFSKAEIIAETARPRGANVRSAPIVLRLRVADLPTAARAVNVSDHLGPGMDESEILLLPGMFVLTEAHAQDPRGGADHLKMPGVYDVTYEIAQPFLDSLMALPIAEPVPVVLNDDDMAAREARALRRARAALLPAKLAPEALAGAYIVYYRAIRGRPVDIFSWSVLPKSAKELAYYMHVYVPNYCDSHVDRVLPFIPEYADLAKKEAEARDTEERRAISRHMATYELLAAVYDPKAKRIITMCLGAPVILARELYRELCETRLEEAADAIVAYFAELGPYAPRRTL